MELLIFMKVDCGMPFPTYQPSKAFFRVTAKKVKLHSCLMSLSVGLVPGGGGRSPRGVLTYFPPLYVQLQTSLLNVAEFVSIRSQRCEYADFTFGRRAAEVQKSGWGCSLEL